MGARILLVAIILFSFVGLDLADVASAGAPMARITACDQVEIEGQTYPRFTFEIHNTTADRICSVLFQNRHMADPADTCTTVAISGPADPSGYETFLFGNLAIWNGCAVEPIEPGETGEGFRIVATEPCCAIVNLINTEGRSVGIEDFCLNCPTAAEHTTWGVVKSRYR